MFGCSSRDSTGEFPPASGSESQTSITEEHDGNSPLVLASSFFRLWNKNSRLFFGLYRDNFWSTGRNKASDKRRGIKIENYLFNCSGAGALISIMKRHEASNLDEFCIHGWSFPTSRSPAAGSACGMMMMRVTQRPQRYWPTTATKGLNWLFGGRRVLWTLLDPVVIVPADHEKPVFSNCPFKDSFRAGDYSAGCCNLSSHGSTASPETCSLSRLSKTSGWNKLIIW